MIEAKGAGSMNALQQALRGRRAEFDANPLLANGGRIMNILDPELYGWANVRRAAERDGIVALSMVDREETLARLKTMFGDGAAFPFWQCLKVFCRPALACSRTLPCPMACRLKAMPTRAMT